MQPINLSRTEIDAKGLKCPLPILHAKKALKALEGGEVLSIWATDQHAVKDFTLFCLQTGHELIKIEEENKNQPAYVVHLWLKKRVDVST
jgi:tRNA 2-thiouridine synthesizing protein A